MSVALLVVLAGWTPLVGEERQGEVFFDVQPREATIGDHLRATLTVELPPDVELRREDLGRSLGPFGIVEGEWQGPSKTDGELVRWTWEGELTAFETGELEVPPIRLTVAAEGEAAVELETEPLSVTIVSVLDPDEDPTAAELADLKPPVAVTPNFGPLRVALALFALLLALSFLLWWLQRRYAGRLAAVPVPEDPFGRVPPHVWVYKELQLLLQRRLAEQGQIDLFYSELARILKLYLGGRYRVDLLEHTTEELSEILLQTGAPGPAVSAARELLVRCDRVKFARERPAASAWREAVESVYRIVDNTRPAEPTVVREGAA